MTKEYKYNAPKKKTFKNLEKCEKRPKQSSLLE